MKKWNFEDIVPHYYLTYYYSGEDEKTTVETVNYLKNVSKQGLRCKVRPHPRNKLHISLLRKLVNDSDIAYESPEEVSLEQSFSDTEYVVGLQSSVLSEAYVEGKIVVIDDMSNPDRYETLKLQKFNIFNKRHILLSDLLREIRQSNKE